MTREWKKRFWEGLERHFREITEEIVLGETKGGDYIMHALFTTTREGGGIALFEAQLFELRGETLHLEIMVLPQFPLGKKTQGAVEEVIRDLNYYTPLGAFGIYYPENQLFLRHVVLLDADRDVDTLVEEIGKTYEVLGIVMGNVYGVLERIAGGVATYEEEIRDGHLQRQE